MHGIQTYRSPDGREPYAQWLARLTDRQARARVLVRVQRMATGNFGDCKPLDGGVWELRIDWGQATASITRLPAAEWCCCWWAATSGGSRPISLPH